MDAFTHHLAKASACHQVRTDIPSVSDNISTPSTVATSVRPTWRPLGADQFECVVFAGQKVGLREVDDQLWQVSFMAV